MTERQAPGPGQAKTCVICGVDCRELPRTKDTLGRYFCKPCFDAATAARAAGRPVPRMRREATTPEEVDPWSVLDAGAAHLGETRDGSVLDSTATGADLALSSAGTASGGGHDLDAGSGAGPDGSHPVPEASRGVSSARSLEKTPLTLRDAWPYAVGGGALVAAGLALLEAATIGVHAAHAADVLGTIAFLLPAASLAAVALWHATGALGVLRHDPRGLARVRHSSVAFLALLGVGVALRLLGFGAIASDGMAFAPAFAPEELRSSVWLGVVARAVWPVAVLAWTRLLFVRRAVRTWSRNTSSPPITA